MEVQGVSALRSEPKKVSPLESTYGVLRAQAMTPRDGGHGRGEASLHIPVRTQSAGHPIKSIAPRRQQSRKGQVRDPQIRAWFMALERCTLMGPAREAVDSGGDGVGADADQFRASVVRRAGRVIELLDESLDVGGHAWSRRQKVGSHQQSTERSSGHGVRSSIAQSSKESRVRSMGRQAGSSGSSSAGGRTCRRPCTSPQPVRRTPVNGRREPTHANEEIPGQSPG